MTWIRAAAAVLLLTPSGMSFAGVADLPWGGSAGARLGPLSPTAAAIRPSAPAAADRGLAAACRSSDPIVVLDNFAGSTLAPYIDVDGDGVADVAHGDLVAALYRAAGKRVLPLNMAGDGQLDTLADLLEPVADAVERGALRISGINVSQMAAVSAAAIRRDTGLPYGSSDFYARRGEINAAVIALMDTHGAPGYGRLSRLFARFHRRGIPILIAAGNGGPAKVSLLSFLPGTYPIGALGADGARLRLSAAGSLVAAWRRGEFVLARTSDGNVDIDGDGIGDFDARMLSGRSAKGLGRPRTILGTSYAAPAVCLRR
ncbi:MAG: hypothetical protein HY078_11270 [Elusimicrobia bacterium]|nr:hypothetical protein [Elusimicrobiota bacterium]